MIHYTTERFDDRVQARLSHIRCLANLVSSHWCSDALGNIEQHQMTCMARTCGPKHLTVHPTLSHNLQKLRSVCVTLMHPHQHMKSMKDPTAHKQSMTSDRNE